MPITEGFPSKFFGEGSSFSCVRYIKGSIAFQNSKSIVVQGVCETFGKPDDWIVAASHPDSDEAFLVLDGSLRLDFRDGAVTLSKGELLVVPKGVEHKPFAEKECQVMVLVRAGAVNTGDALRSDRTTDPAASI